MNRVFFSDMIKMNQETTTLAVPTNGQGLTENPVKGSSSRQFFQSFREIPEEKRRKESQKIRQKHPDRIAAIVVPGSARAPEVSNHKYLVPKDITMGQFMIIIRSKMKLEQSDALFLFISDKKVLVPGNEQIGTIYNLHANTDGYLYVFYDLETTFGSI